MAGLLWSTLTSRLAGPVASALAAALACFLAAALLGKAAQTARAETLSADRDAWKLAADRWQASFTESEALRGREGAAARHAATEAGKACEARLVTARRSARAIQSIVTQETAHDANGCLARGLVPVERLRNALAPAG